MTRFSLPEKVHRGRVFYEESPGPRYTLNWFARRGRQCEGQKSPEGGQTAHARSKSYTRKMLLGEGSVKKGRKEVSDLFFRSCKAPGDKWYREESLGLKFSTQKNQGENRVGDHQ